MSCMWIFDMPGIESAAYLGLSEHCWALDNEKFTILQVISWYPTLHDFRHLGRK